ncbi:hypothetical protein BT67DRAFT_440510 [Trichocladium antarcticum]|uniref:Uncharacterized protein n=1 Tax=Trichocladium antarcticum TaxID=1450529 RepID=A0AAN6ZF45_9PEZI|nr:hypothetical protein BT67DRAFT_440510 [Trichocladium antarcticum]
MIDANTLCNGGLCGLCNDCKTTDSLSLNTPPQYCILDVEKTRQTIVPVAIAGHTDGHESTSLRARSRHRRPKSVERGDCIVASAARCLEQAPARWQQDAPAPAGSHREFRGH